MVVVRERGMQDNAGREGLREKSSSTLADRKKSQSRAGPVSQRGSCDPRTGGTRASTPFPASLVRVAATRCSAVLHLPTPCFSAHQAALCSTSFLRTGHPAHGPS